MNPEAKGLGTPSINENRGSTLVTVNVRHAMNKRYVNMLRQCSGKPYVDLEYTIMDDY